MLYVYGVVPLDAFTVILPVDCPQGTSAAVAVAVTEEGTVMVTILEVAVADEAQDALEVITTETWSPFARELDEKLGLLVPAFTPLTFHW